MYKYTKLEPLTCYRHFYEQKFGLVPPLIIIFITYPLMEKIFFFFLNNFEYFIFIFVCHLFESTEYNSTIYRLKSTLHSD